MIRVQDPYIKNIQVGGTPVFLENISNFRTCIDNQVVRENKKVESSKVYVFRVKENGLKIKKL